MIQISTMQHPGQAMNWNSVLAILHREREPQFPLPSDWLKTATTWHRQKKAENLPNLDNKK